ncbi:MAG TPA: O-antigen ligase family protein, partial [Thiolinea sp.]|nr:O-antigen ligase family protein [Thiolinea sp.]
SSGKSVTALIFLEMVAVLLLSLEILSPNHAGKLNLFTKTALWFAVLSPVLYLIPLSLEVWQKLPGHSLYLPSIEWLSKNQPQNLWLTASLVPQKTVHAVLTLLPLLAIFIITVGLSQKKTLQLITMLLVVTSVQACIGLIQVANPEAINTLLGIKTGQGGAQGTYLNRDHFPALMYMMLPFCIGLLILGLTNQGYGGNSKHTEDNHKKFGYVLIIFSLIILVLVAGIGSRSRMGIALLLLALILSLIFFIGTLGIKRLSVLSTVLFLSLILVLATIGTTPIINRFLVHDPSLDARFKIFPAVLNGIADFFPVGSGPGTFQEVFRIYHPPDIQRFVNHAHNDYLELVFEMGFVGIIITINLFISWIWGWSQVVGLHRNDTFRFLKIAAGISILMVLIHCSMDFILHTPANAAIFTFLLAIFLKKNKYYT